MPIPVMLYESSTPTSKELSSSIFQSLSVFEWGIGVTWPDLHFSQYLKALYWPNNTNNCLIVAQYHQVPTIAVLYCNEQLSQLDLVSHYLDSQFQ